MTSYALQWGLRASMCIFLSERVAIHCICDRKRTPEFSNRRRARSGDPGEGPACSEIISWSTYTHFVAANTLIGEAVVRQNYTFREHGINKFSPEDRVLDHTIKAVLHVYAVTRSTGFHDDASHGDRTALHHKCTFVCKQALPGCVASERYIVVGDVATNWPTETWAIRAVPGAVCCREYKFWRSNGDWLKWRRYPHRHVWQCSEWRERSKRETGRLLERRIAVFQFHVVIGLQNISADVKKVVGLNGQSIYSFGHGCCASTWSSYRSGWIGIFFFFMIALDRSSPDLWLIPKKKIFLTSPPEQAVNKGRVCAVCHPNAGTALLSGLR